MISTIVIMIPVKPVWQFRKEKLPLYHINKPPQQRWGLMCLKKQIPRIRLWLMAWARLYLPSFFLPPSWLTGRIYRFFKDLQMKNEGCRDGAHRLKLRIAAQNLCPSRKNGLWWSCLPAGTATRLSILLSLLTKQVLEIGRGFLP